MAAIGRWFHVRPSSGKTGAPFSHLQVGGGRAINSHSRRNKLKKPCFVPESKAMRDDSDDAFDSIPGRAKVATRTRLAATKAQLVEAAQEDTDSETGSFDGGALAKANEDTAVLDEQWPIQPSLSVWQRLQLFLAAVHGGGNAPVAVMRSTDEDGEGQGNTDKERSQCNRPARIAARATVVLLIGLLWIWALVRIRTVWQEPQRPHKVRMSRRGPPASPPQPWPPPPPPPRPPVPLPPPPPPQPCSPPLPPPPAQPPPPPPTVVEQLNSRWASAVVSDELAEAGVLVHVLDGDGITGGGFTSGPPSAVLPGIRAPPQRISQRLCGAQA